jgi:hypothetical protein
MIIKHFHKNSVMLGLLVATLLTLGCLILSLPSKAYASYDGQRIIDDALFLDANRMSEADIQQFLTNMGGGIANMTFLFDCASTGSSSAAYYANAGAPCGQYVKASSIIYYASQIYGINPQVTLATMQKEQSLVTAVNPTSWQVNQAMGFGCPDSGGCSATSGFLYQIDNGVWTLRFHMERARGNLDYWFHATSWVCGTTKNYYSPSLYPYQNVNFYDDNGIMYRTHYISNPSTSSFYCYTPHAYNNPQGLYGLPAYGTSGKYYSGSYNFVRYFELWFGSTKAVNGNIILSKGLTTSSTNGNVYMGETLTASYQVTNTSDYDVAAGGLGICGRMNGKWYDFGYKDQTVIPANDTITVSYSKVVDLEGGALNLSICSYHASLGGWAGVFYPWNTSGNSLTRTANLQIYSNPTVTSSVTPSSNSVAAYDPVTVSTTLRNSGPAPINVGSVVFAARDSKGRNYDFPVSENVVIPANSSVTISGKRAFSSPDSYRFYLATYRYGTWSTAFPAASSASITTSGNIVVSENPLLSTSLTLSDSTPAQGQSVTAAFAIKNNASVDVPVGYLVVAARDPYGNNVDFPGLSNVVVPANSVYTYSTSRTFEKVGSYSAFIANYDGQNWRMTLPSANASLSQKLNFSTHETPLISTGLSLNPIHSVANQPVSASFSITNESELPVSVGSLLIAARDPNGNNVDFPLDVNIIIPPHESYTYNKSRTFSMPGTYRAFIASYKNNIWSTSYPSNLNTTISRSTFFGIAPNPTLSNGISVSGSLKVGSPITVSAGLTNEGELSEDIGLLVFAARDPNGNNVDFPADANLTLPALSTTTYSKTRAFSVPGTYTIFLANYRNNLWSASYPTSSSSSVVRSLQIKIQP